MTTLRLNLLGALREMAAVRLPAVRSAHGTSPCAASNWSCTCRTNGMRNWTPNYAPPQRRTERT